jgi:uroporphyrinogen-III decarboxylase
MKPFERLYGRMDGKPVDKIPNLNIVMGLVAKEAGVSYSEYAQNYKRLVDGNLICAEKYGIDVYCAISDPARESAALGAKVKLHICGDITPILPLLKKVTPDILDIDHMVDFAEAVNVFHGTPTAVNGHVDPVSVMLQGDAETVRRGVSHCIEVGDETTMSAAGCEIPAATPPENLVALNALLIRNAAQSASFSTPPPRA